MFCMYILFCYRTLCKNSLTEWSTPYKYISNKKNHITSHHITSYHHITSSHHIIPYHTTPYIIDIVNANICYDWYIAWHNWFLKLYHYISRKFYIIKRCLEGVNSVVHISYFYSSINNTVSEVFTECIFMTQFTMVTTAYNVHLIWSKIVLFHSRDRHVIYH